MLLWARRTVNDFCGDSEVRGEFARVRWSNELSKEGVGERSGGALAIVLRERESKAAGREACRQHDSIVVGW